MDKRFERDGSRLELKKSIDNEVYQQRLCILSQIEWILHKKLHKSILASSQPSKPSIPGNT